MGQPAASDTYRPLEDTDATRRDFLFVATGSVAAVGAAAAIWPLIDSMNPSADSLAVSAIEVDLKAIEIGQRITVKRRGQPLFVDRRSARQIEMAQAD